MEKPGYIYLLRVGSPNLYRIGKASQGYLKQRIYGHGYGTDPAVTLVGFVQVGDIDSAKSRLIQLFSESRGKNPFTQRYEDTFRFNDLSCVYQEYARTTQFYPTYENLESTEDVQEFSEDSHFIEHLNYWWNYWDSVENGTETYDQVTSNNSNETFSAGSPYSSTSEIPGGLLVVGIVILGILSFFGVNNKIPDLSNAQSNSRQTAKVIPFQGNQKMNVRSCADLTCNSVDSVSVGENITIIKRDVNGWSEVVTPRGKQGFIDPRSIK